MSDNLLDNETHTTDFHGTIKTVTKLPVNGDEIENVQEGDMVFDEVKEVLYGYSGSDWYGTKGFTTSTSSSTSTSTSTTTTA
jgi:hypothetical protein